MAFEFASGDKALGFQRGQLYEVKVLETAMRPGADNIDIPMYYVHYAGWNKSWDEWLWDTRILKFNDENLERQRELRSANAIRPKPKEKDKKVTKVEDTAPTAKRRRADKTDNSIETEVEHFSRPDVKIVISDDLKQHLVDDWNNITRQNKLVSLPSATPVDMILEAYCKSVEAKQGKMADIAREVASGLKDYFRNAIGTLLLYRQERYQFQQLKGPLGSSGEDLDLCAVYGAEHLLRLCIKMPMLVAHTNIDEKTMTQIALCLSDILRFISKNSHTYLVSEAYALATSEYLRNSS